MLRECNDGCGPVGSFLIDGGIFQNQKSKEKKLIENKKKKKLLNIDHSRMKKKISYSVREENCARMFGLM